MHAAQLRVEISQSRKEQKEYLKNVELARVLDKRAERKRKVAGYGAKDEVVAADPRPSKVQKKDEGDGLPKAPLRDKRKKARPAVDTRPDTAAQLDSVLGSIF